MPNHLAGDYIPISLIAHEDRLSTGRKTSQVAIYRLEYKAPGSKRSASGQVKKRQRTWEFVNVHTLYAALQRALTKFGSPTNIFATSAVTGPSTYMRVVALLVGLSGTDFSRPITHITPEKMWGFLAQKNVWDALMKVYNHNERKLDVQGACDMFIAELYKKKFSKYTSGNTLQAVMQNLQKSSLSPEIKRQLPTPERIATTIRNINFLLLYWECTPPALRDPSEGGEMYDYSVCYPDAICDDYGFRRTNNGKGTITWLDC